jgi:phospholipid/cholesterol/gamma-HCH transport system ATP-binding protein
MVVNPIVEVRNLGAGYGEQLVLKQISCAVYPGEIFMIIGGSGSGKTTLLNHMIGLLAPISGDIFIDGVSINRVSEQERLLTLKKIGVLYQSGALFGSMSLLENVALPLEELTTLPAEAIFEVAVSKLKMVGLENFTDYLPAAISGGMQKRAALARAMALDPKILFLDEPTSGLDPLNASAIDQLVVKLAKVLGITFVIVSHDILSIHKVAQKIAVLEQGQIVAIGTPRELKHVAHPLVQKFFA